MARILVTCPQQSASAESYYASLCPQVCPQVRPHTNLSLPAHVLRSSTCACRSLTCCTSEIS